MTENIKNLSDLHRADVAHVAAHLPEYESKFRQSVADEGMTTFGRALIFRAAREVATADGGKFSQSDYVAGLGKSKGYGSLLSLLNLAIDKGIDPDGSERDGKRWTWMVQHGTSAVRSALGESDARKRIDALMAGKSVESDDETETVESDDETETRAAQPPNDGQSFASLVSSLESVRDALRIDDESGESEVAAPKRGDLARLESVLADLTAAHADWSERVRESETPTAAPRSRGARAVG